MRGLPFIFAGIAAASLFGGLHLAYTITFTTGGAPRLLVMILAILRGSCCLSACVASLWLGLRRSISRLEALLGILLSALVPVLFAVYYNAHPLG
jgi:prepilin signal peptidase PulO-like enzyme (type II secretory pathway)